MRRLFVVKQPCIIECKYYEAGELYSPSAKMSDIALNESIKHNFLEEKFPARDRNKEMLDYISGARLRAITAQNYIRRLQDYLDNVERILEEN